MNVSTNSTITILPPTASPTYVQGKLVYDTDNECMTFFNNESDISLQVGQEEWIRVYNNSGATITNGKAVYITGTSSGLPTIAKARADALSTADCIGLATHDIENNSIGYVTKSGAVRSIDTSAFTAGATVYLDATTAGSLTATIPSSPNYKIKIGVVSVSNASTGQIVIVLDAPINTANLPGYQGYSLYGQLATTTQAPADSTVYYAGTSFANSLVTTAALQKIFITKAGTIKAIYINGRTTATLGTNENNTFAVRLNNATDTTISSTTPINTAQWECSNTALSIAVVAGDYIEIKWTTPAYATNPTGVIFSAEIYIE